MSAGRVAAVWGDRLGTSVATAAGEGDQVISVGFAGDFDEDGGQLIHRESGEVYGYDTADPDGDTITLSAPLPTGVSWVEGDALYVYPLASDWYAAVHLDDVDEEPVIARLPFSMRATLPDGIREAGEGEPVTVEETDDEWAVTDVGGTELDRVELRDAESVTRVISGLHTDGTFATTYANGPKPPTPSAPTLTAVELGLVVFWDGLMADGSEPPADVQRIDVHESETSGFTVDGSTIKSSLPAEGARLLVLDNQTHYVKLVAVTTSDVASDPSTEVSATPLAVSHLAAGSVDANALASLLVLASRIVAGDPSGARVELNSGGLEAYDAGGVRTVFIDGADGSAEFTGRITGSEMYASEVFTAETGQRIGFASSGSLVHQFLLYDGNADLVGTFWVPSTGAVPDDSVVSLQGHTVDAFDPAGFVALDGNKLRIGYSPAPHDSDVDPHLDVDANGVTISGDIDFTQPAVRVRRTTTQAIAHNAFEDVSFDTEDWNNDGMWSSGSTVTINTAGLYIITGNLYWDNNGTGQRAVFIRVNGNAIGAESGPGAVNLDSANHNNVSAQYRLAAGDQITLVAFQNSGGSLNLDPGSAGIHLELVRVAA